MSSKYNKKKSHTTKNTNNNNNNNNSSSTSNTTNYLPADFDDDDYDNDDYYCGNGNYSMSANVRKTCENMKITIVEDITLKAGLNDQPFDATLDAYAEASFQQIKSIHGMYQRGPTLSQHVQQFYGNCSNPFLFALKMFANCPDCNTTKLNTLPYIILTELRNYKLKHHQDGQNLTNLIDINLKMVAFNFITKLNIQTLFKIVIDAFELIIDKELFIDKIKELIAKHKHKEACHLAYELQLYDEFTIFDMVLPLLLQDKISVAEMYLDKAKHLQIPLLNLLDSFFDKSSTVQNICSNYISKYDYQNVNLSKIQNKPLNKLIMRLAKKYNVGADVIPNIMRLKNYGVLQYIMHKKFNENSLSVESWREMIKDTVSKDAIELQSELISTCSLHECTDALYWIEYYNYPHDELCNITRMFVEKCEENRRLQKSNETSITNQIDSLNLFKSNQSVNNNRNPSTNKNKKQQIENIYHTLKLQPSAIDIVDTKEKFYKMLNYLNTQYIIAFDAEWKPTFNINCDIALIQLATKECIFLIDVVSLILFDDDWSKLGKCIFNNNEILKLAFAVTSDLNMFQKSIPALGLSRVCVNNSYIDLQDLWMKVNNIKHFQFPYDGDITGVSLKLLVKLCLGKELDKSDQFSNWQKRPLRPEQINYAALDAYCLLEIYDVIGEQLKSIGYDFNEFINKYLDDSKIVLKSKPQSPSQPSSSSSSASTAMTSAGGASYSSPSTSFGSSQMKSNYNQNRQQYAQPQQQQQQQQSTSINKIPETDQVQPKKIPIPIPIGPNRNCVRVEDVKFICDIMLDGLAKKLRTYGIDALTLSNHDDREMCIRIALAEKRYILTRGSFYFRCVQYVPLGHCYQIMGNDLMEQIDEVLKYYNITVFKENIFSRCKLCNSSEFFVMSDWQMKTMLDAYYQCSSNNNNNNNYYFNSTPSTSNYNHNYNHNHKNVNSNNNNNNNNTENYKLLAATANMRTWTINPMPVNKQFETNKGVSIKFHDLPKAIVNSVPVFYICEYCGKCYWDGSHYDNLLNKHKSYKFVQ